MRSLSLLALSSPALCFRAPAPRMGLLDGAKKAFGGDDKPLVSADRITPFDRWLGLDKELVKAETPENVQQYVDPNVVSNYFSSALTKPMGIAFVENDGDCGGVYVDDVLSEGSAAASATKIERGDQLVAVDSTLVLGTDFDSALDVIKSSSAETTKLTFYRGPTVFLYGPTRPAAEWYEENLL